jgi:hypothetical protein
MTRWYATAGVLRVIGSLGIRGVGMASRVGRCRTAVIGHLGGIGWTCRSR